MLRFSCFALCLTIGLAVQAQDAPPPPAPPAEQETPVASFEQLKAFLTKQNVQFEADDESQNVAIPTQRGPIDSVMVIRWAASDGVVHFVQIMPFELPADRIPAVESAIVRMNHAYPVPGLGMNHDANAIYFRFTVPLLPRGSLSEDEISEFFSYTINQAAALHPTIEAVIKKTVAPEGALAFHNANAAKGSGPFGTWSRELAGSTWKLQLNQDGSVELSRDETVVVKSTAKIEGNSITYQDNGGALATKVPGAYTFTVNDDGTLSFEAVNDSSKSRRQVLTGEPWTR